jgi:Methane oxygenase PmoA
MIRRIVHLVSLIVTGVLLTITASGAKITAEKIGSKINVTVNGRFFTAYIFSDDEKYPFFYPVNGPLSGGSVTSMRNGEYPHHSSLFFGCDLVNGGNFWQEGLERGRIISVNAEILKQGGDTVLISDECIWSRPGAAAPFKDRRTYTITAPTPQSYVIDVKIELEALLDVTIKKTNHSLFSARIAADLSVKNGGTMINAENLKNEAGTFGIKSAWLDFYGKRGTVTEGIAIMQHPSNPWYPSPWFTRDYGFMSPTPMYWPENDKDTYIRKASVLTLRYRVIVHEGDSETAGLAKQFASYSALK